MKLTLSGLTMRYSIQTTRVQKHLKTKFLSKIKNEDWKLKTEVFAETCINPSIFFAKLHVSAVNYSSIQKMINFDINLYLPKSVLIWLDRSFKVPNSPYIHAEVGSSIIS